MADNVPNKRPTLNDPEEYRLMKRIYFGEKKTTEESDRQDKRNKKQTNQAR